MECCGSPQRMPGYETHDRFPEQVRTRMFSVSCITSQDAWTP